MEEFSGFCAFRPGPESPPLVALDLEERSSPPFGFEPECQSRHCSTISLEAFKSKSLALVAVPWQVTHNAMRMDLIVRFILGKGLYWGS